MRIPSVPRLVLVSILLACVAPSETVLAGGVGLSEPPDSVLTDPTLRTSGANINETPFHYYKVPVSRGAHANRDYEFLWSDTYKSRFHMPLDSLSGVSQLNDMDRLGQSACEVWSNPLGLEMTDIEIAYNYLANRDTLLDALGQPFVRDSLYDPREFIPVGFRTAIPTYVDAERAHLDAYIYASSFPEFPQYSQWGSFTGDGSNGVTLRKNLGMAPSEFTVSKEDSSTGHAQDPLHGNSLMIPGPPPWGVAATHDYRWTGPLGGGNANLVHESLHALNADGMTRAGSTDYLHMFASGAEVMAGVTEGRPWNDFDYTYSLTPDRSNSGNAYPHWQAWTAWLAFNWRGIETTTVGWSDDLLRRWATRPWNERTMIGLANRLRDSECGECADYPGFGGLNSLSRLQRLLHDWRVAMYVNSTTLPGGRFGFPPQFGFSPFGSLWAWRGDADQVATDDAYSVPPIVPIGAAERNQELRFTQRPAGPGFSARPLRLNMFGAEYFVFKADPSLAATQQKLTVRVHLPGLLKGRVVRTDSDGYCQTIEYSGRLYASLITYSQASDSLFLHPEWATSVTTHEASLDRASPALVFDAPGFGTVTKAALLVVSLEDGQEGAHTTFGTKPQETPSVFGLSPNTYDFEISAVAHQEVLSSDPLSVAATSFPECSPTWSPAGDSLAFEATDASGHRGILIAPALSSGPSRPLRPGTLAQHDPSWSPRDGSIAFAQVRTGGRDLWLVTSTGVALQLTNQAGAVHEPAFSPNGSQIAYFRYVRTYPPPEDTTTIVPPGQQAWVSELRWYALNSGADVPLATFSGDSAMSNLRWAPDGKRLFFHGKGEAVNEPWHLWQMNTVSGQLSARDNLAPGTAGFDVAPGRGFLLMAMSAEFIWKPYIHSGWLSCTTDSATRHLPFQSLVLRDTSSGSQSALPQVSGGLDHRFRYSPDGTKLAYVSTQIGDPNMYVASTSFDRAPAFTSSTTYYLIPACAPFNLPLSATDADGDPITREVFDLPAGAVLQGDGTIH